MVYVLKLHKTTQRKTTQYAKKVAQVTHLPHDIHQIAGGYEIIPRFYMAGPCVICVVLHTEGEEKIETYTHWKDAKQANPMMLPCND